MPRGRPLTLGKLRLAGTEPRLVGTRRGGRWLGAFGSEGPLAERLLGPQYLAADDRGFIYVSDWGNQRVAKYDPQGNYVLSFEGLSGPSGIAVDGEVGGLCG